MRRVLRKDGTLWLNLGDSYASGGKGGGGSFMASPKWREQIQEIRELGLTVNFSQGLDIRLVNDENARVLASIRFSNLHQTKRQLHFAWDDTRHERAVRQGIETLKRAGIKPYQMTFYVLAGFGSGFEDALYRVTTLVGIGVDPYLMPYSYDDPRIGHLGRWVNARIYKVCAWEDYTRAKGTEGQLRLEAGRR